VVASKSENQTALALNSGAIHLLRALDRVDRESGLTPARLSALSVLVFGGPCSLGELAAAEQVAGPTMTRIVDGLVGLGLAERTADPSDRRAVRVAATAEGTELMRTARGRRVEVIAKAVESLPAEQRRLLDRAAPLLDQVARGIREGG
jgi:DNA-binding MarR family transcriptional regulator